MIEYLTFKNDRQNDRHFDVARDRFEPLALWLVFDVNCKLTKYQI